MATNNTHTKGLLGLEITVAQPEQPPQASARELRNLARRLRRVCDLIDDGQEIELDQAEINQLTTGLTKVEKLLKARKGPTTPKRKPKPLEVNGDHIAVLKWVSEHKFATTTHAKKYLPVKDAADSIREAAQAGYLTAYRYERHKGTLSEKCYWISSKGANLLLNHGIKARPETRYKQTPPDENDVHFATMELELPHQARLASWKVIKPEVYNSANPKGDKQTRHTTAVATALHLREQRLIREAAARGENTKARQSAFEQHKHLTGIPLQLNHHIVYKQDSEAVMIFVLCPPEITRQFLEARFKEYAELNKRVKTWLVFYSLDYAKVWAESVTNAGFGIATLASLPDLFKGWDEKTLLRFANGEKIG